MTTSTEMLTETLSDSTTNRISVSDIMTTRVVTIEMDDRLVLAKEIFDNVSFHHLLVVDNEKLSGILSHRDFLRALSPNIGTAAELIRDTETLQKRVHQVMTHNPITIAPHCDINQATKMILDNDIGCLPVLENNIIVGIITWKDLLNAYCVR
ncbi:CBS domain-containing protein [Shewanella sp. SR43-4]|jgi:acetoin utilization protein AcuB|uniref:CBS domain-containing protein n=1 Tax=Shewanella vesiculosa TaxID=518738 RepID=A0ABV0FQ87_9GAMM|nr:MULTISPECIES: CBS domain-containing protein [Shewanella]NCQ43655.1 CBS domain-containing protein [Shewanella frigidimarina]MBB1316866.1 CBS domain-containing protein [Shewanella sp. SR43-4]MBB1321744.1 CBS domain-containing protein [Shewanella sp. SR43-8]MBB1388446.1 CBS domain-containing protein [Shewanella sp. SG44-6]MBB1476691.1 CBS domain-containing protein [Shewanella sp. SG41-3]|tara:strand:+ start:9509 stop:9967 length:459 start_codon:yes stop_codon:yes gene_type:complete